MVPDTELLQQRENAQKQQMAEMLEKMTEEEKKHVVERQTAVADR